MIDYKYDTQLLIEGKDLSEDEIHNYIMNNINNRIVIISTHDEEDVKKLRANVLFVDNKAGSCYNNVWF